MAVVYLDCAATTPIDPRVRAEVLLYLDDEFGNAGSRTHDFGRRARAAVERARDRVAAVAGASRGDVFFTSGATESNNLAILGLAPHGEATGRKHIVTTRIEHHAVLEPIAELERRRGFRVTWLDPEPGGFVDPAAVAAAMRPDTLLVSVMAVNNETGVLQPVHEIADAIAGHPAYFHTDAAQAFGKAPIDHPRVDLISVSGHKIYAPKGIGALVLRRRSDGTRPPLTPLFHGGGQERGLRPGTQAVHLIAGLGKAAELALLESAERTAACLAFRERLFAGLAPLSPVFHGDQSRALPNIVNFSIPGVDSETLIESWADFAAISDGAACTSQSMQCSHVLGAMALPADRMEGAVRLSWSHQTPLPDLEGMVAALESAAQTSR